MNYISAEQLSKSYGEKILFKNINIGINEGDKVALIGINGSGKSSLLKIIGGIDVSDGGTNSVRKGTKIGFLGQNPVFDETKTVFENVFSSPNSLLSLIKEYELLLKNEPESEKMYDLIEKMNQENAWNYEQQIKEIISRLGISEYIDRNVGNLSGGQRKRVAMAKLLIDEPDVLVLDEPTNHLDLETVEWLENIILNKFRTLVFVTHDRYFLDKISNIIWELEGGQIYKYAGNYAYYLEKKSLREEVENAEVDKAKNLMRKELEWIRRQPKARGTKAKYRVDAFEETKAKANSLKTTDKLDLQVKMTRQGGKVLVLKNIAKKYGELSLINNFSYTFNKGEKIGIIGKNGTGKTTFINILTGLIKPDKGDWDLGDTTQFGYFKQEDFSFNPEQRLIEAVKEIAEYIELANGQKVSASQFLKLFLFPPEVQYTHIGKLSGGEKKRLQMLMILIKNPNFLILDEPTNDLDLATLNVLEDFLIDFKGTLIIVSHDRYFMDKMVDHLFVFEGNGEIKDFPGNYTDYRESKKNVETSEIIESKPEKQNISKAESKVIETAAPKKKMSFKEKTEYENLEKEIEKLEKEKTLLIESLNSGITDHNELNKISTKIQEITDQIDIKSLRWLELGEMA